MHHILSCLVLLVAAASLLPGQAHGQTTKRPPDSPVFKDHPATPVAPRVPESDALEQIWNAFVVARKAQAGDKFAQQELALRYIAGKGVERDTAKAAQWFERAAAQGLTAAKFDLAILAYHGWGVPWDPFRAYSLVKDCAATEMPEAEFMMASFLTEGLMVPRNWQRALALAQQAADAGYAPAVAALPEFQARAAADPSRNTSPLPVVPDIIDSSSSKGTGNPHLLKDVFHGGNELRTALGISKLIDDSSRVDSVSLGTVRRAARYGSPEALTVLGRCYEKGIEVRRDSVEAAAFYVRAIRLDSPRALELMLALLRKPTFITMLKEKTGKGEPAAEFVTAALAGLGIESGVSQAKAVQLLHSAVEATYVPALVELGLWHYSGRWVVENRSRARALWYQAASEGSVEAQIRLAVTALRDSTDPQVQAAQVGLLRAAADEGSILAEVALGYCHEHGVGVRRDMGEAARYYRSAAARGSQDAYRALIRMYDALRPKETEFKIES